jgi:hypothetical protein
LKIIQDGCRQSSEIYTARTSATYDGLLADVARVIEAARHAAARSVNAIMTITYWLVGRRIIEQEQHGAARAAYGEELLKHLARDLSKRFGRGFSERNLEQMRAFYLGWPISQTASAKLIDASSEALQSRFPLFLVTLCETPGSQKCVCPRPKAAPPRRPRSTATITGLL